MPIITIDEDILRATTDAARRIDMQQARNTAIAISAQTEVIKAQAAELKRNADIAQQHVEFMLENVPSELQDMVRVIYPSCLQAATASHNVNTAAATRVKAAELAMEMAVTAAKKCVALEGA